MVRGKQRIGVTIRVVIVLFLLMASGLSVFVFTGNELLPRATASYEVFTTGWTEYDESSDLTVNTNSLDWESDRDVTAYLYKDYGAGHFDDFYHHVDVRSDFSGTSYPWGGVWMMSNTADKDARDHINDNDEFLLVSFHAHTTDGPYRIDLHYNSSKVKDYYTCSANTWYYLNISRSGTSVSVGIYSSSNDRDSSSNELDTLTCTDGGNDYRYLYACASYDSGAAGRHQNIDIDNLDIHEGGTWTNHPPSFSGHAPTGTTLLTPTANITITDDDGNNSDVYWYISTDNATWGTASQHNTTVLNESVEYIVSEATSLDTTYYVKVAADDAHDNMTRYWSFTTMALLDSSAGFGGKLSVLVYEVSLELYPTSFPFNTVNAGSTSNTDGDYFTIWNNDSVAAKINITVNNSVDWTSVAYASVGVDKFSVNYTTDNWVSETNINPNNPPTTTLTASLAASSTLSFGLRIVMPTMTTTLSQQSFEVWIKGEVA